jgi:hypothetical protein
METENPGVTGTDAATPQPSGLPLKMAKLPEVPVATPAASDGSGAVRAIFSHPHSFYDDNMRRRSWNAGDIVDDPAEVEMLMGRGAPISLL